MKQIIIGLILLFVSTAAIAENKKGEKLPSKADDDAAVMISGTVLDSASGELLVGVEVMLEGAGSKTYTDFDGNFSFEGVQPGEYKLVTSYISYKKNVAPLNVDPGKNEVNIELETSN